MTNMRGVSSLEVLRSTVQRRWSTKVNIGPTLTECGSKQTMNRRRVINKRVHKILILRVNNIKHDKWASRFFNFLLPSRHKERHWTIDRVVECYKTMGLQFLHWIVKKIYFDNDYVMGFIILTVVWYWWIRTHYRSLCSVTLIFLTVTFKRHSGEAISAYTKRYQRIPHR